MADRGAKTRVLMILDNYPQISQTYIKTEIEAVQSDYELRIIAYQPAAATYRNSLPCEYLKDEKAILERIRDFAPQVLHTHWFHMSPGLYSYARQTGIPFTVRAHSFDTLAAEGADGSAERLRGAVQAVNSSWCLGMLVLPFTRPLMERIGIHSPKLIDCRPAVNYAKFQASPSRGRGVMNLGICIPKKGMRDFVDLARRVPDRPFHLYLVDNYAVDDIEGYNRQCGSPVTIHWNVDPDDMPAVYQQHEWLIYTSSEKHNAMGWPMAVAEAQAAGLGVCIKNIRPDIREYLGPSGFAYDSIQEVEAILSRPVTGEMKKAADATARLSDIQSHKRLLTDLWDRCAAEPRRSPETRRRWFNRLAGWFGGGRAWRM